MNCYIAITTSADSSNWRFDVSTFCKLLVVLQFRLKAYALRILFHRLVLTLKSAK
jgi:hypothetical protein